ncbi:MAG: hypothetical protein ABEJ68_05775 [Halobacteriaceae archaeon]
MAGALDTVYVVAAVALAVVGVVYVAQQVHGRGEEQPWFEWGTLAVGAVFLLALAAQYV